MTVIVAGRDPDKGVTWIASDRQSTAGGLVMYNTPKWAVCKPWAVGIAGSLRALNVVQAHADDLFNGLAGAFDFSCRVRGVLEQDGFNFDQQMGPRGCGSSMVLAHAGGVWSICDTFSVEPIPDGEVWADGDGARFAIGAAYAAKGTMKERVRIAAKTAIRFADGCGGDVYMECLKA
jgi:ATP-dependent protease HslVU (ClpYQ) peptidase subunit